VSISSQLIASRLEIERWQSRTGRQALHGKTERQRKIRLESLKDRGEEFGLDQSDSQRKENISCTPKEQKKEDNLENPKDRVKAISLVINGWQGKEDQSCKIGRGELLCYSHRRKNKIIRAALEDSKKIINLVSSKGRGKETRLCNYERRRTADQACKIHIYCRQRQGDQSCN
jgi:hypothetical protein